MFENRRSNPIDFTWIVCAASANKPRQHVPKHGMVTPRFPVQIRVIRAMELKGSAT
jgi:hypothetical protein